MGRWKALNLERFVSRNHPEHELNFIRSSLFAGKTFPGKFPFLYIRLHLCFSGKLNVLHAGNFASVAPAQLPAPHQYSLQDRTDMYRKAFELMKVNKLDGETELSRLDKLFAMK
jgi:hypothetical protein